MTAESLPLVSVVVPCFNSERYVAATIESILANTRPDLPIEIIAVNDHSSDGTAAILRGFGGAVRLIDKPVNDGVSRARNTGIAEARAEYVAFCDHDDLWEADKLRLQLAAFARPEIGLVCSDASCFDESGIVLPRMVGESLRRGRVFPDLLRNNFVITSSVVVRRGVFSQAGQFDPTISHAEDLDLWLRVAQVCEIDYVDRPLVRYRLSPSQISRNKLRMKASRTRIIERHASRLRDRRLAQSVVAEALYGFGMDYWYAGQMEQAREKFLESARRDPLRIRYFLRALGTFVWPVLRRLARSSRS